MFGAQPTFGQPQQQAGSSLFGAPAQSSFFSAQPAQQQQPAFGQQSGGGLTAQQQPTSYFPTAATSGGGGFSFGTAAPGTGGGGGLFSTQPPTAAATASFLPAQQQTSLQQQPSFNFAPQKQPQSSFGGVLPSQLNTEAVRNFTLTVALTNPQIYGENDERNATIARLNQLQAFCGFGKGFFSSNASPIEFTGENPYCRLKSVCYNRVSGLKDEDGLMSLIIKKSEQEVKNNLQSIIDNLVKLMGGRLAVNVEAVKPLPENRCEIILYITETGFKRRIPSSECHQFFNQPNIKQQISSQLLTEQFVPKVDLTEDKLKEYLALPPSGIDHLLWNQAVADNPDPSRLIPYAVVGFSGLRERQKMQKIENETHVGCLKELANRMERVEEKLVISQSKLLQLKNTESQLSHRLLKAVSLQLIQARQGYSLEANEEALNSKLENVNAYTNGSAQLKGRLAEILSHFRNRNDILYVKSSSDQSKKTVLNEDIVLELKQHLRKYQDAVEKLVDIVKRDHKDLNLVKDSACQQVTSSSRTVR